jgi:hypothetical protein
MATRSGEAWLVGRGVAICNIESFCITRTKLGYGHGWFDLQRNAKKKCCGTVEIECQGLKNLLTIKPLVSSKPRSTRYVTGGIRYATKHVSSHQGSIC